MDKTLESKTKVFTECQSYNGAIWGPSNYAHAIIKNNKIEIKDKTYPISPQLEILNSDGTSTGYRFLDICGEVHRNPKEMDWIFGPSKKLPQDN